MDDKKRLIVLLVVLGVALVGGGLWFYFTSRDTSTSEELIKAPVFSSVDRIKKMGDKNRAYIGNKDDKDGTVLENLYGSEQYRYLEDNSVKVTTSGAGNPEPFAPIDFSTTTTE